MTHTPAPKRIGHKIRNCCALFVLLAPTVWSHIHHLRDQYGIAFLHQFSTKIESFQEPVARLIATAGHPALLGFTSTASDTETYFEVQYLALPSVLTSCNSAHRCLKYDPANRPAHWSLTAAK